MTMIESWAPTQLSYARICYADAKHIAIICKGTGNNQPQYANHAVLFWHMSATAIAHTESHCAALGHSMIVYDSIAYDGDDVDVADSEGLQQPINSSCKSCSPGPFVMTIRHHQQTSEPSNTSSYTPSKWTWESQVTKWELPWSVVTTGVSWG